MDKRCFNSTLALDEKKLLQVLKILTLMKSLVKGYKLTAQLFIIIGTECISFWRGLDFMLG